MHLNLLACNNNYYAYSCQNLAKIILKEYNKARNIINYQISQIMEGHGYQND